MSSPTYLEPSRVRVGRGRRTFAGYPRDARVKCRKPRSTRSTRTRTEGGTNSGRRRPAASPSGTSSASMAWTFETSADDRVKRVDVRPRRVVEVRGEVVERVRRGDQLQPRRFPRRLNPQRVRQRLCRRFPLPSVVQRTAGERVDQAAIAPATARAPRPPAPTRAPRATRAGKIQTIAGDRRRRRIAGGRLRRRRRAPSLVGASARRIEARILATSASARPTPGAAAAALTAHGMSARAMSLRG